MSQHVWVDVRQASGVGRGGDQTFCLVICVPRSDTKSRGKLSLRNDKYRLMARSSSPRRSAGRR